MNAYEGMTWTGHGWIEDTPDGPVEHKVGMQRLAAWQKWAMVGVAAVAGGMAYAWWPF